MDRKQIFVYASNLAGRNGAGSALEAQRNWKAIYGVGEGIMNDSCYAIPTKGHKLEILSLKEIGAAVDRFLKFAAAHPDWDFRCVRIGCGLAGYKDEQICHFFAGRSPNVYLHPDWVSLLDKENGAKLCTVINIRSGKPYTHYFGRPGKGQKGPFGNPWVVGRDAPKGECVLLFEKWLKEAIDIKAIQYLKLVQDTIKPGDILACFCNDRPCHAWVIADYVNNGYKWKN